MKRELERELMKLELTNLNQALSIFGKLVDQFVKTHPETELTDSVMGIMEKDLPPIQPLSPPNSSIPSHITIGVDDLPTPTSANRVNRTIPKIDLSIETILDMFDPPAVKAVEPSAVDEFIDPKSGSCWTGLDHLFRQGGTMESRITTFYTLYGDMLLRPLSALELADIIGYTVGKRGGDVETNIAKSIYRLLSKQLLVPLKKTWGHTYVSVYRTIPGRVQALINSKM